ncbi:piRNA biogenesis protein EXD1 [Menidia menidia]
MLADDAQFMSILKGKRIKLTLKNSSYFGVVQRINPNKTLVLADVSDGNGRKCPGTKIFFGHEILNVEFPDDASAECGNETEDGLEEQLNLEKFQSCIKATTLSDDEEEEDSINFVVVDEFYEKFGPAVMHIKRQHVIGVGAEGVGIFQNGRLCWLQIATKNKVYLFDILLLGGRAFKNGLSMILESKHILKVIHDCRAIAGSLVAQFGVKLTNVFDTQVADAMCFYSETGGFLPDRVSTLQEVVSLHLKVPFSRLSSLQMKPHVTKEEQEIWYKRPCPVPLLKALVLSVIHLQPLRLQLLDGLMSDYMGLVDSYLNSSHYQPDELAHVSMQGVLELPVELRQLEDFRHERREWATSHFPVTAQGQLERFNPHPEPPPRTSAAAGNPGETQPGSCEPATEHPPSPPQMEPLIHPTSVTTAPAQDVHPSSKPRAPSTASAVSHLQEEVFDKGNVPTGVNGGCRDSQINILGGGRSLRREQSSRQVLPSMGRGFLLHLPPPQIPGEPADLKAPFDQEAPITGHTLCKETEPHSGCRDDELSKDVCSLRGEHLTQLPQSASSSLSRSFRSFRC